MAVIRKIGLCVLRDRRLLVARKKGGRTWILLGGKPEKGETDEEALEREVMEEAGRNVAGAEPLLVCRSPAADRPGDEVELVAYIGAINGEPVASEEIEEFRWIDIDVPEVPIAPSISDHVLPALRERAARPRVLMHGTSSTHWDAIRSDGVLRRATCGDLCVSLTDDVHVARYHAANCCSWSGGTPIVLVVDVDGLDARPHSSAVWGEGGCDWERETACWDDVPIERISVLEPAAQPRPKARSVRYDKDTHRIQIGDEVVALAQRLTNDRWVLNDMNDRRMEKRSHASPKEVAAAYDDVTRPEGS